MVNLLSEELTEEEEEVEVLLGTIQSKVVDNKLIEKEEMPMEKLKQIYA